MYLRTQMPLRRCALSASTIVLVRQRQAIAPETPQQLSSSNSRCL